MERKNTRLKYYDYSKNGAYFITMCTKNKKKILGTILSVGDGAHDVPKMVLSKYGKIVDKYIKSSEKIKGIKIDKYVIMPNHIHLIIIVDNNGTSKAPSPTNSLIAHTVSTFKRLVNKEVGADIFQRSYYDHIIRDENDYQQIWKYIDDNPLKWKLDKYYDYVGDGAHDVPKKDVFYETY